MSDKSPTFVYADPKEEEQLDKGIKRQILGYGPDLMAVKVWFEDGAIGYEHTHPHTQIVYVESGEFEATVGGETSTLKAGDSIYVEPNVLHGSTCIKAGVLIDIFNPVREDFLEAKNNAKK